MVSENIFLRFSHYKSVGANDPRGTANLDPMALFGRIFVGDHHLTLLHTKYISCGPHGYREENSFFSIISPWELMNPRAQGGANLDPRTMVGRIYVGDH